MNMKKSRGGAWKYIPGDILQNILTKLNIWNKLGSAEVIWAFDTLGCHRGKQVKAFYVVSG